MKWLLFEDEQVQRLYPITIGRASYAISCGAYRLYDRLSEWTPVADSIVRPHLAAIERADFPCLKPFDPSGDEPLLCVNARLAPAAETVRQVRRLADAGEPFVIRHWDSIAAALLPPGPRPASPEAWTSANVAATLETLIANLPEASWMPEMFELPHDVVRCNMDLLGENLQHRLEQGEYHELRDGVFAAEGAKLSDYVVTDTTDGPILLDQHASIGPYCFLSGPAYVGPRSRVIEHAALKDGVSVGHTAKIGGEVEASVIEPYTNKQHYGFLGHSYLGSWINLGAGTCNSDLKNTYGLVNMEYSGVKVKTGMQFVGCIMGDYAKSAINTGIFTGKTIGACSMLYGFITENVPSFVNYARLFGQVAELPPEVMIATQQRMFFRRDVQQRECDMQLIRDMFNLTRFEREWSSGDVLSL